MSACVRACMNVSVHACVCVGGVGGVCVCVGVGGLVAGCVLCVSRCQPSMSTVYMYIYTSTILTSTGSSNPFYRRTLTGKR